MSKQEIRKNNSEAKIKSLGIDVNEGLPYVEDSSEVELKSIDKICERALASMCAIQVACDVNNNQNYEESVEFFKTQLKNLGIEDCLNSKEKKIFDGTYTSQDAIDLDWEYESMWSLFWALGLVDDISNGGELCDCEKAIELVFKSKGFDDFKSKCKLRDIEEILDMLDLYYRYHWAVVDNYFINKETKIGNLNHSVVAERRRGLEWLISTEEDWYEIDLST